SSANCGSAMIVLNTIMAKQLKEFKKSVDKRISNGEGKDEAILKELQRIIKDSKKIRFEGNGYGEEWVKEANKRGLSNLKDTPRALQVWHDKKVEKLFTEMNVLSPRELEARREIEFENYVLKIQIESRLMGDITQNYFTPAAIEYQNKLIQNVQGLIQLFGDKNGKAAARAQIEIIERISLHLNEMRTAAEKMLDQRKAANKLEHAEEKSIAYCDNVKAYFDEIRYHADKLELLVEDELWPLPKFRELLFTR
ncbi:MAG: glutamine synthetase type III, partial [Bacteroidetes bacterium]|nr:glutamine synthetase type III [Bacteroidota bacterium]